MPEPIHIISLGAGVQSSTMALMAAAGEITPMPVAAIFADTQAEPKSVYTWLDWLEKQLPFPVHRVTHKEGLTKAIYDSAKRGVTTALPPFYTGANGHKGQLMRACTNDYKVKPVAKMVRKLGGGLLWIGISIDEIWRIKQSRFPHYANRHPLIELRKTRNDCLQWMKRNSFPEPPKSACTYCPYRPNDWWKKLHREDPASFAEAVAMDVFIRTGLKKEHDPVFVHRSCKPLSEVDFSTEEERGQLNMFNNECEGMCGV